MDTKKLYNTITKEVIENGFIKNAYAKVNITLGRGCFLCLDVSLTYDSGGQGYGGYAMCEPIKLPMDIDEDYPTTIRVGTAWGATKIREIMQFFGTESFVAINEGTRVVRVLLDEEGFGGKVIAIGHPLKDEWFTMNDWEEFDAKVGPLLEKGGK